jgi:hypothetical protein
LNKAPLNKTTLIKTMELVISPVGETQIQTRGFTGSSCREASRFLEQALGTRSSEKLTGEFYQQASESTHTTDHA